MAGAGRTHEVRHQTEWVSCDRLGHGGPDKPNVPELDIDKTAVLPNEAGAATVDSQARLGDFHTLAVRHLQDKGNEWLAMDVRNHLFFDLLDSHGWTPIRLVCRILPALA